MEFIELNPTSALAQEWFLFVDTSDFWATLIAKEIDRQSDRQWRFDGIWSYDDDHYTVPVLTGAANGKGRKILSTQGISGQVINQGRLIHIREAQRSESDVVMPSAKSLIAATMVCRKIRGAITIGSASPNQWNDEDAKTLMTVTKIIALQLDQRLVKSRKSSAPINTEGMDTVNAADAMAESVGINQDIADST